jgi:hypothetical protein
MENLQRKGNAVTLQVPEEFRGIVKQLTGLAVQQDLASRAMDSCANRFRHDAGQLTFTLEDVHMQLYSHSLFFQSAHISNPFIATRLTLSINDKEIGYYRLITSLDGSVDDDYLVLEDEYHLGTHGDTTG